MVLAMSRPWRDPQTGSYYLRQRVPKDLAQRAGQAVIKVGLGTKDPVVAKLRHAHELAKLSERWRIMREGIVSLNEREAHALVAPLHDIWLKMHRNNPSRNSWFVELYPTLWTANLLPGESPQPGIPGTLPLENLLYKGMRFWVKKLTVMVTAEYGLDLDILSQHNLKIAVAAALQRASLTLAREATGIYGIEAQNASPQPSDRDASTDRHNGATLTNQSPNPALGDHGGALSISDLFQKWWREASAAGRKQSTYISYRSTSQKLVDFLGHDDAKRVTRSDVRNFKDHRLTSLSKKTGKAPFARTVKNSDLVALNAIFGWAVANDLLSTNPASGLTIKLAKAPRLRAKWFTSEEASRILTAALRHESKHESPRTSAAKKWVPWLCAFTGARVGEIAQLRKEDVRIQGNVWVIRITPEAGTQKTNEAREIPLHRQIVELGFPQFVASCPDGHLFLKPGKGGDVLGPLQALKNRLAEFGRRFVTDPNVAPNHGWRHRFKTVGMEAGIAPRILDAIQGQAARTVADTYGDVTLTTMSVAIERLPNYELDVPVLMQTKIIVESTDRAEGLI